MNSKFQSGNKEKCIWASHGGKVNLWETKMSGPFGDESDLPVFDQTSTVYHHNYRCSLYEAVGIHLHQIVALLNHVGGLDEAPKPDWEARLFWGKFVGSD